MQYLDSKQIDIGDIVRLNDDELGQVVALFDQQKFMKSYETNALGQLKKGVLINSEKYGLIHYTNIEDNDVVFVSRK